MPPLREPFQRKTTNYDCFKLELVAIPGKEVVFSDRSTDSRLLDVGKDLRLASGVVCADSYNGNDPITCYQATLHCLPDMKSFHLEVVLLWRESLETSNFNRLQDEQLEIFSKRVLREPQDAYEGAVTRRRRERVLESQAQQWTPRDFY